MEETLLAYDEILSGLLDAAPALVFVVDHDVRILHLNAAVRDVLGLDLAEVYRMRAGTALACVNGFRTERGCGRNAACEECVIRTAVGDAIQGFRSDRKATLLECRHGGRERAFPLQVSAFPITYRRKPYVLLVLEPSMI